MSLLLPRQAPANGKPLCCMESVLCAIASLGLHGLGQRNWHPSRLPGPALRLSCLSFGSVVKCLSSRVGEIWGCFLALSLSSSGRATALSETYFHLTETGVKERRCGAAGPRRGGGSAQGLAHGKCSACCSYLVYCCYY